MNSESQTQMPLEANSSSTLTPSMPSLPAVDKKSTTLGMDRNSITSLLEIASYPVAAIAGYMAMDTRVRKSMYANFAKRGVFNDLQATRQTAYREAIDKVVHNGSSQSFLDRINTIEHDYRMAVREWFSDKGMSGLTDYWKVLQRNQKIDVLEHGATVTGISLGALLLIAQNRHLVDFFNKKKEEEMLMSQQNGNGEHPVSVPGIGL